MINVNGSQGNVLFEGCEVIGDSPAEASEQKAPADVGQPGPKIGLDRAAAALAMRSSGLEFSRTDAKLLIKGAKITPSATATALAECGNVKKRDGFFASLGKAIGRGLMSAAHAVRSFFKGDVFRSAWQSNNVKNFDRHFASRNANLAGKMYRPPALPELPENAPQGDAILFVDKSVVAAMCGFKDMKKVTVTPMFKDLSKAEIFPKGSPKLADIVQDPALQDCWFLSGITSKLAAEGPEALTRLINYNKGDPFCTVRMGNRQYKVALSDVCCRGTRVTSSSAPWVRILEQAAAMRMSESCKLGPGGNYYMSGYGMSYGEMSAAQNMLSGREIGDKLMSFEMGSRKMAEGMVDKLKTAFRCNIPVEIGHVKVNDATSRQKAAGVFVDSISPGHAVALLDVKEDAENTWLTVMDPYGHTRIINADALERCEVQFGVSEKEFNSRADAYQGKEGQ